MSTRIALVVVALVARLAIARAEPAESAGSATPGSGSAVIDGGVAIDGGVIDGGVNDRGAIDGGVNDGGVTDGAAIDGEPDLDAGVAEPDGPSDAGVPAVLEVQDAGVTPRDATSAIVGEPPPEPMTPPTAETTTESTVFAIKVIGGLIVLLVLAYLGAQRRVVRFQEQLGISGVITAGFPFVALGLVASLEPVGILNPQVIENLRSILFFGLGWLGFIIGAQLDIRVLERVPRGTGYLIIVEALGPFVAVGAACGGLMLVFGSSWTDPTVWRDAILLGTAAAMTAPRKFRGFANRTWRQNRGADVLLAQLDELVGVIGLLFITAYFRPETSAWDMPSTAWVFTSLGIGVVIGALIFVIIRIPSSNAEFFAVLVGGIAFASGFAGYLDLSPIVICFIAGTLVTNFPNDQREQIFRILRHLERPVHLLFLIIAGALWTVTDWRGWVLVPVFVAARVLGKWAGVVASRSVTGSRMPERFLEQRVLIAPLSALSTALVISFAGSHASQSITWVVTAVIGGAIVTELLIPAPAPEPAARQPLDELDDGDDEDGHEGPRTRGGA